MGRRQTGGVAKRQFLQLLTVVYDPRIARGSGIINNATHLGLEFEPRINRETHYLDRVLFRKFHGNKPVFSVDLCDKEVQLDRMNGALDLLPEAQAVTVKQSVHEVINVHSEGIVILVEKAQRTLKSWGAEGLKFFDFLSPEIFLSCRAAGDALVAAAGRLHPVPPATRPEI